MEVCRLEVLLQYMKRDRNKLILLYILWENLESYSVFASIMNYGDQAYVLIFSILQIDPGFSMKKLDDSLKETTTNDPQSPVQPRVLFFKSIKFLGKEEYQTRYFL